MSTTLTEEQIKIVHDVNEDIPESVVLEYIAQTGDEDLDDFQEAYSGEFDSDEDFAQDMAEQTADMPKDLHWPLYCIDWTYAAKELMMDYFEIDGYYFRSL